MLLNNLPEYIPSITENIQSYIIIWFKHDKYFMTKFYQKSMVTLLSFISNFYNSDETQEDKALNY